ncbi:hypothetical protein [Nonomuraea typhae]|uniref:hypothetical protein n=1 Tax=Nonomuraea typhae TaxID=2603600 RepID=UPI0012F93127|nr:hypothetical protein [Nonomuraea typhae]
MSHTPDQAGATRASSEAQGAVEPEEQADAARLAEAQAAPEPPEPVEDHGDSEQAVHRELLWGSDLPTSRLDRFLPHE